MDPQATWDQLQAALASEDWETTRERAQSLLDWLALGGFPPVTSGGSATNSHGHRKTAVEFCRRALQRAADG